MWIIAHIVRCSPIWPGGDEVPDFLFPCLSSSSTCFHMFSPSNLHCDNITRDISTPKDAYYRRTKYVVETSRSVSNPNNSFLVAAYFLLLRLHFIIV